MAKKKGLGKLFAGLTIGAGLGMLFAPKKGSETREELKAKLDELIEKAKKVDKDEVKDEVEKRVASIKEELETLDKEKVLKIAKKKAKEIEKSAQDLVDYAIEKGTPVLEGIASNVREKAIEVTKEVLDKLEKGEK